MNEFDVTRLEALLIDQATGDLDEAGQSELAELLKSDDASGLDIFERLVAETAVATLQAEGLEPLPDSIAASVIARHAETANQVTDLGPASSASRTQGGSFVPWSGWLAAAALAGWLLLGRGDTVVEPVGPTTAELRESLITAQATQLAWTATEDPAAAGATGDVVWSGSSQSGVMRFAGLEANDPSEFQYQLWIFDATRDDRFPVDGGVFNVPAGAEDVLVEIRAKIDVREAALFAVTVEQPGGVVVSDRERIVLLAQAG